MQTTYRLVVEGGPDQGRVFVVPERGCGLGRSSQNAVALRDEQLSRLHCRFHFRNGVLWVTDLASANGTRVDGVEATEQELRPGCRIAVGESVLRLVVEGGGGAPAAPAGVVVVPVPETPDAAPSVDLGLAPLEAPPESAGGERQIRRTLLWALAAFVALIAAAVVVKRLLDAPVAPSGVRPVATAAAALRPFELRYEKVEANADNIFRYDLTLDAEGHLAVHVDDLVQRRHVRRESERPVDPALRQELTRFVEQSGFFGLDPAYEGIAPLNTHVAYDLTVLLGVEARRVRVANRAEPDAFRTVRERIETFARNELGLWAVEFSSEKLVRLAHDAYLLGARLVREKDIQTGNLHAAIQSFRESAHFLDTVEPKPDFHAATLDALRAAGEELAHRHRETNLLADRAIHLKNWDEAAAHLRELLVLIPDRSDDRHRDAERRLLDVESRLKGRR